MAVYCKDCGHVNEKDSIYQRDAKGDPVYMAGSQNAPRFRCIRCGSKNIVPIDEWLPIANEFWLFAATNFYRCITPVTLALILSDYNVIIVAPMTTTDDNAARMTLRIAGVLQEIRDIWARRLDVYYTQIESLVDGQWLDTEDVIGIIKESRMASREALDGLGGDLSAELVHTSNGVVARYESERLSFVEEINDLRDEISRLLSGDENAMRRENESLRAAIDSVPEFKLLKIIQRSRRTDYKQLEKDSGEKKSVLRKLVKELMKKGYVNVDKKSRPHAIIYLTAPWIQKDSLPPISFESPKPQSLPPAEIERR